MNVRRTTTCTEADLSATRALIRQAGLTVVSSAPTMVTTDDDRRVPGYVVAYLIPMQEATR